MFKFLVGLSAEIVLLLIADTVLADSFLYPVQSSVCMKNEKDSENTKYKLYDKAAFIAIKSSAYMQEQSHNLDDHNYDILAYKIADNALENIAITTVQGKSGNICIKLTGDIDKNKADKIINETNIVTFDQQKAQQIAKENKEKIPATVNLSDEEIPLIFIEDLKFYNNTTSEAYTEKIAEQLSLEPEIFVIDDKNLADYILIPHLLQSKNDKIDDKNSRYSMSVELELQDPSGKKIESVHKNRYIIVSDISEIQTIAQKLLIKLIKECLVDLRMQFKHL